MKDETRLWLNYADDNLKAAVILLKNQLYNPCLQNVQQCVEKSLKAALIENSLKLRRTHSIGELKNILIAQEIPVDISDDECDLLDSVYLPSKYPFGSALPNFEPNAGICHTATVVAERVLANVKSILKINPSS